jgi:hypothetical protein
VVVVVVVAAAPAVVLVVLAVGYDTERCMTRKHYKPANAQTKSPHAHIRHTRTHRLTDSPRTYDVPKPTKDKKLKKASTPMP